MDVTLGSLGEESLRALEGLGVLGGSDEEEEVEEEEEDALDEEEEAAPEVTMADSTPAATETVVRRGSAQQRPQAMRNRGMPYFESMVENSRLGRIKRQKGGHTSRDGRTRVRWEVVELDEGGNGEGMGAVEETGEEGANKRPRLEP